MTGKEKKGSIPVFYIIVKMIVALLFGCHFSPSPALNHFNLDEAWMKLALFCFTVNTPLVFHLLVIKLTRSAITIMKIRERR
jgi:hypothetical protein